MMILVTGGSKCGKSCCAESLMNTVDGPKYYLATMIPYGEEAFSAIDRHHIMRADKCFLTVEQYTDIDRVEIPDGSSVLLECLSNLLANEMFRNDKINICSDKIAADILRLKNKTNLLVVVTNQVGHDGICYERGTTEFIAELGRINQKIAANADKVIECVYGIPVTLKG